jgi:hypothetical protein
MKTVFVPIFSGIEGKNVLRGGIYDQFVKRGFRVIFFVGNYTRRDYYQKEYPEVTFEVIKRYRRRALDRFFSALKFFTLKTKTIDLKRQKNFSRSGSHLRFVLSFVTNRILGNRFSRTIIRFLDARTVRDPIVTLFFDTYRPDAVFLADLFEDTEISMLREARRRGIPTIGYLSTWDRLTSRWGIRLLPDTLIVFNELLRDEAILYADMPAKKIVVSGAVQLDLHLAKPPMPRAEFLKSLHLSLDTRIIVYGPLGRTFDPTNQSDVDMVKLLNGWVESGALGNGPFKIIVRFPPNDFVDRGKLLDLPHVIYDIPGVRFATVRGQDWDMKPEELDHLRDLLSASSVVVCYYSSLSIDAAVFDVPVININFDLADESRRHPYYQTTHYSKVASVGGIRLVESALALRSAIKEYLDEPSCDRVKREELVKQQAYRLDGGSARRIVDVLERSFKKNETK